MRTKSCEARRSHLNGKEINFLIRTANFVDTANMQIS